MLSRVPHTCVAQSSSASSEAATAVEVEVRVIVRITGGFPFYWEATKRERRGGGGDCLLWWQFGRGTVFFSFRKKKRDVDGGLCFFLPLSTVSGGRKNLETSRSLGGSKSCENGERRGCEAGSGTEPASEGERKRELLFRPRPLFLLFFFSSLALLLLRLQRRKKQDKIVASGGDLRRAAAKEKDGFADIRC